MDNITVIVADDHSLFREGLCAILSSEHEIEARGAGSWNEMVTLSSQIKPDVILLDSYLADSCKSLSKGHLGSHYNIVILLPDKDHQCIVEGIRSGVKGFILKNVTKNDLIIALKAVAQGNYYFCKEISKVLLNQFIHQPAPEPAHGIDSFLSKREKDILKYISQGFTNNQIAEELFISAHTVATHRRNLLQKINVKNTAGLVRYASKLGLLN